MKRVLITGAAGFIGYHLSKRLISENFEVYGIDNLNEYYDVTLKLGRLKELGITGVENSNNTILGSSKFPNFHFLKLDLKEKKFISDFVFEKKFNCVINLAAQAGVRYSIKNPQAYIDSNIYGFQTIIDACIRIKLEHLIFASTSSVYGLNESMPLNESLACNHPMSLYAATKKSNEMVAHSYSHLFDLPCTALRFFTVYGPWGRPDMALFLFTEALLKKEKIKIFNHGNMVRDFTYVADIVESIFRLIDRPPKRNTNWDGKFPDLQYSSAPYQIFNIGNGTPVNIMEYIQELESKLNIKGIYEYLDMQPGDVAKTEADTSKLYDYIQFKPKTSIDVGIKAFVDWYLTYYNK